MLSEDENQGLRQQCWVSTDDRGGNDKKPGLIWPPLIFLPIFREIGVSKSQTVMINGAEGIDWLTPPFP